MNAPLTEKKRAPGADDSAYPLLPPTDLNGGGSAGGYPFPENGLTKRELFAAMAMAQLSVTYALPGTTFAGKVAEKAVEYADALLKELAK